MESHRSIYIERTGNDEEADSDKTDTDEKKDTSDEEEVITYTLRFKNIRVLLGEDENLEEKMRRVEAIIPLIEDQMGELHLENFDEDTENIVFDTNVVVE